MFFVGVPFWLLYDVNMSNGIWMYYNGCLDRVKGMGLNQIEWMDPLMGIDFDTVDGNPANQLIW